jgi:hypothetical protein
MSSPVSRGASVIELERRTLICVVRGCGGTVVRHSLGAGQAVDRCTRCFRRYEVTGTEPSLHTRLRRAFDEFISWRE